MSTRRIAGGILAAAALAGAAGCGGPDQSAPPATPGAPPPASMAAAPPTETLTPLLQQALPNVPGKTFTSAIVDFPPGARAAPHRHGAAFVYTYVLEGTVRSALDNAPARTYHQGENWVEQPGAHHVLTENTSQTDRAKLLVVFVSNTGDSLKVDDPQ